MVQFECPRVIYPLVSFTLSSVLFPACRNGKCRMWTDKKVKISFEKTSLMYYKVQFESAIDTPRSFSHFWDLLRGGTISVTCR